MNIEKPQRTIETRPDVVVVPPIRMPQAEPRVAPEPVREPVKIPV